MLNQNCNNNGNNTTKNKKANNILKSTSNTRYKKYDRYKA